MIIPQTIKRINKCLELAESINLTNSEEERMTLELTHYFKKLIIHVLTKREKELYKKKVKFISSLEHLNKLSELLKSNTRPDYYISEVSLKTNIGLLLNPNSTLVKKQLFQDLLKTFDHHSFNNKNDTYFIAEYSHNLLTSQKNELILNKHIEEKNIKKLIIHIDFLTHMRKNISKTATAINEMGVSTLIIKIENEVECSQAFELIKLLTQTNANIQLGLSLNFNNKNVFAMIYKYVKNNHHPQHFILRFNKSYEIKSSASILKINTYYKWAVYSLFFLVKKNSVQLLVQSNNLHDISWLLLLRAQLKISKQVQFETNISKHPNIAKILFLINKSNIKSTIIFLDKTYTERINIILKKLTHQARIFELYKKSDYNISQIFIKSHRRFFNFLRRNYLQKYLKKFNIED